MQILPTSAEHCPTANSCVVDGYCVHKTTILSTIDRRVLLLAPPQSGEISR
jgi:hypothetical protein